MLVLFSLLYFLSSQRKHGAILSAHNCLPGHVIRFFFLKMQERIKLKRLDNNEKMYTYIYVQKCTQPSVHLQIIPTL